jgi:hypothetical protein
MKRALGGAALFKDDRSSAAQSLAWYRTRRAKVALVVVIALGLLVEQVVFAIADAGSSQKTRQPHFPPTMMGKLDRALTNALGSSDRGVRRFRVLNVTPTPTKPRYHDVTVRWAINNDLSGGTLGNGAQADVFLMLSNLYTSGVRLDRINLVGTYPETGKSERTVMNVWMNWRTASVLARNGWGTLDAEIVWPLVHRAYVSPNFQPAPSE